MTLHQDFKAVLLRGSKKVVDRLVVRAGIGLCFAITYPVAQLEATHHLTPCLLPFGKFSSFTYNKIPSYIYKIFLLWFKRRGKCTHLLAILASNLNALSLTSSLFFHCSWSIKHASPWELYDTPGEATLFPADDVLHPTILVCPALSKAFSFFFIDCPLVLLVVVMNGLLNFSNLHELFFMFLLSSRHVFLKKKWWLVLVNERKLLQIDSYSFYHWIVLVT